MSTKERKRISHAEWLKEGTALFGMDILKWRFVCPICKHVQSGQDYKDAGAPGSSVGFSCVGRWVTGSQDAFHLKEGKPGPCNYAGGGLFRLNPVDVVMDDGTEVQAFEFDRGQADGAGG